jgi:hypothetical protein
MPVTEVAKLFGVSDQAVEKRCKKFGIQKPKRGYWTKAEAGRVMDALTGARLPFSTKHLRNPNR